MSVAQGIVTPELGLALQQDPVLKILPKIHTYTETIRDKFLAEHNRPT